MTFLPDLQVMLAYTAAAIGAFGGLMGAFAVRLLFARAD